MTNRERGPGKKDIKARTVDGIPQPGSAFVPWATMFKLSAPDSQTVECVSCKAMFSLRDLLNCELEEDECPACLLTASAYWAGKPHRDLEPEPESGL